jgi:hypothetical protein
MSKVEYITNADFSVDFLPENAKVTKQQKRELFNQINRSGYTGSKRTLLEKIHELSKKTGSCYASYRYLAEEVGITRRNAQRNVADLIRDGVIICRPCAGDHGQNLYELNWTVIKLSNRAKVTEKRKQRKQAKQSEKPQQAPANVAVGNGGDSAIPPSGAIAHGGAAFSVHGGGAIALKVVAIAPSNLKYLSEASETSSETDITRANKTWPESTGPESKSEEGTRAKSEGDESTAPMLSDSSTVSSGVFNADAFKARMLSALRGGQ